MNYASGVWTPNVANSHWQKLEARQNDALRCATGCLRMTGIDHLRNETQCIPIKDHCRMLATWHARSFKNHLHPCHDVVFNSPDPPRNMKTSLKRYYVSECDKLQLESHTTSLKEIHTGYVKQAINNFQPNRVLNDHPPLGSLSVDRKEQKLDRKEQVRLAQLRSGFCSSLNDYRHRIGIADSPLCRKCQNEAESVNHYLSCNYAESAELLWKDPEKAAALTRSI